MQDGNHLPFGHHVIPNPRFLARNQKISWMMRSYMHTTIPMETYPLYMALDLSQDLGAHGIAPRRVTTKPNFAQKGDERQKRQRPLHEPSVIPGEAPLQNLIVPARYAKVGVASVNVGIYMYQSLYVCTSSQNVDWCPSTSLDGMERGAGGGASCDTDVCRGQGIRLQFTPGEIRTPWPPRRCAGGHLCPPRCASVSV